VRHLPRAFARAIAVANRADSRWRAQPLGLAGEASLKLSVFGDGSLGELTYPNEHEQKSLSPVVQKLLENTRLLLASGRFSLQDSELAAGVLPLRVRVEIEQGAGSNDDDPTALRALDYEAPRRGKPGHGAFTLTSGRRVVAWVMLE
jgi:hypothetical protein